MGRDEGLLKSVNPTQNLDKTRKPTSADSGIMDIGQEGDDLSNSSKNLHQTRPSSSDYSSDPPAVRRSRSQPPKRIVSFAGPTTADDKLSDLDRSVSARFELSCVWLIDWLIGVLPLGFANIPPLFCGI